jgi:hypothetical protein
MQSENFPLYFDIILLTRFSGWDVMIANQEDFFTFRGDEAHYECAIQDDYLTLSIFNEVSKQGVPQSRVGKRKFRRTLKRIK